MRRLSVFNMISVDGYIADARGDMSWAHKQDPEWMEFSSGNASGDGMLLFGRKTYEMMASWWPSDAAKQAMPQVAEGMNRMPKVVFSRGLERAEWNNTTVVKDDLVGAVWRLKGQDGPDMVVLGSGSVVAQLAEAGLIDAYQMAVINVALGGGKTMFEGLTKRLPLKLVRHRVFGNGSVVLEYEPG